MEFSNSSASDSKEPSYNYIPWLRSPINERPHGTQTDTSQSQHPPPQGRIGDGDGEGSQRAEVDIPTFRRHHEANPLELYFDLYFIANLTTFVAHNDIENLESTYTASMYGVC